MPTKTCSKRPGFEPHLRPFTIVTDLVRNSLPMTAENSDGFATGAMKLFHSASERLWKRWKGLPQSENYPVAFPQNAMQNLASRPVKVEPHAKGLPQQIHNEPQQAAESIHFWPWRWHPLWLPPGGTSWRRSGRIWQRCGGRCSRAGNANQRLSTWYGQMIHECYHKFVD